MAGGKSDSETMIARLLLTIVGVLLIVGSPFSIALLNLTLRFHTLVIAGLESVALVAGLVLLYLAFREST